MNLSQMTELSLRAAVSTSTRNLSSGSDGQYDAIKSKAVSRASELVNATSTASAVAAQTDLQGIAIGIAVEGLRLAYSSISSQLASIKASRLSFDKERISGIASFIIRTKKEEKDLSKEEKFIKDFIKLAQEEPLIFNYLGIHHANLSEEADREFYSIVPFYEMSHTLKQHVASPKPLDQQRASITLFLKSSLPESLDVINADFQGEYRFLAFFSSIYQGENYLNHLRVPRFMMIALANLLWNIQHPVDEKTGYPITTEESVAICRKIELLLNRLIDTSSPPYISRVATEHNGLLSFLRQVELQVKGLRAGYQHEIVHEINITDVANTAHRALRLIDDNILKLIYRKYNPVSKQYEPEERAAKEIAYLIFLMSKLIENNREALDVVGQFTSYVPHPEQACLNYIFVPAPEVKSSKKSPEIKSPELVIKPVVSTVVDVLIVFCHLPYPKRHELYEQLKKIKADRAKELARSLFLLDQRFIKPIRAVIKKELEVNLFHPKYPKVALETARVIVPLLTLVAEDYRVYVDTDQGGDIARLSSREGMSSAKTAHQDLMARILTGSQQIELINSISFQQEESLVHEADSKSGYYYWSLSRFFEVSSGDATELDVLPKQQYRMTKMTKMLDGIAELITNYRHVLQDSHFQEFLINCFQRIKMGFQDVDQCVQDIDIHLSKNEKIDRGLSSILRPMLEEVDESIDRFTAAAERFEKLIQAKDLASREKKIFQEKIKLLIEQYKKIFIDLTLSEEGTLNQIALENEIELGRDSLTGLAREAMYPDSPSLHSESMPFASSIGLSGQGARRSRTALPGSVADRARHSLSAGDRLASGQAFSRGATKAVSFAPFSASPLSHRAGRSPHDFSTTQRLGIQGQGGFFSSPHQGRMVIRESRMDASTYEEIRKMKNVLGDVIDHCYDSLSLLSQWGEKGELLRDLKMMLKKSRPTSEGELSRYFLELSRIVLSYRPTFFFQAQYGQTRSAKALMDAICNPTINQMLKINHLLGLEESGVVLDKLESTQQINILETYFRKLQRSNGWEEAAVNMRGVQVDC